MADDSIDILAKQIKVLGDKLGIMPKQTSANTEGILRDYRKLSDMGVNFSTDAVGMQVATKQMRMTTDEFATAMDSAGKGFVALGGTMNDSAKTFTRLSQEFFNTDAADNLRTLGYTSGELNEVLAITAAHNRKINFETAEGRQAAAESRESAAKLALEMDKVAQLTGVSRKEQEKNLKQNLADSQTQMGLQLLLKQGNSKVIEAQTSTYNSIAAAGGKGAASLYNALIVDRALTDKEKATQVALGSEVMAKLHAAAEATKHAKTEEDKIRADQLAREAQDALAKRGQSEDFLRMGTQLNNGIGEATREVHSSVSGMAEGLAAQREKGNQSSADAAASLRKQIDDSQKGTDETGKKLAGAATTEGIIKAQNRIEDAGTKFALVLEAMNARLGASLLASGSIADLQNVKDGKSAAQRLGGEDFTKVIKGIREGAPITELSKNAYGAGKEVFNSVGNLTANAVETATIFLNPGAALNIDNKSGTPISSSGASEPKKYAGGTKDVHGDWFGANFGMGTDAILHGTEAVIPKDKLNEFISDMQSNMNTPQVSNMQEIVQSSLSQMQNVMASPEISKIQDSMSSMINNMMPSEPFKMPEIPTSTVENKPQIAPQPIAQRDENVTLKDVNDQLIKLNTSIAKLVSTNVELLDTSQKGVRATKKLSPNLNAR